MSLRSAAKALRAKLRSLSQIGFVRSVGILVGGTAFAQLLTVVSLPLVTRLYTPADFSALAVFLSIVSIASIVACLRLEIAIPLPASDIEAANLLASALIGCAVIAIGFGFFVFFFAAEIIGLLGQSGLRQYLWLVPLAIWLASSYSAFQFWATRKKRFAIIAKTRVTQAVGGVGTQMGCGWLATGSIGLFFGQTISSGAGLLSLIRSALRNDRESLQEITWVGMRQAVRKYDRFLKYGTFEAFANSAGLQLPIIIIASAALGPEAGYLMLATRAMTGPMSLVGGAIAQVYLSKAPEEFRKGNLGGFSADTLAGLIRVGVGPLLFIGIVAPPIFSIVFGQRWERSGEIVGWMIPWFVLQFMSSPISMVMHVVGKQRAMLVVTLLGLLVRLGAVMLAAKYAKEYVSEIYAISGGVFYFGCCWVFSRTAGVAAANIRAIAKANFVQLSLWIFVAASVRIFFYLV